MSIKVLKKLKKIAIGIILMPAIAVFVSSANYAIAADVNQELQQGKNIMGQMMGSGYESMDGFMDQMMGANSADSMYEMMGKISDKGINADDLKPMARFMSACQNASRGNYTSGMMGNWGSGIVGWGLGLGSIMVLLGMLLWAIFWIAVILGIIAVIRWIIIQLRGGGVGGKALDILKERYAKGEIAKEEYEVKKKELM